MKVDNHNSGKNIGELGGIQKKNNSKVDRKSELKPEEIASSVKLDFSPDAKKIQKIKELAMAGSDIDEEKVARLQKLIDSGQYKINAENIADKLVDEHLSTPT